jgi:hypothetical protein
VGNILNTAYVEDIGTLLQIQETLVVLRPSAVISNDFNAMQKKKIV